MKRFVFAVLVVALVAVPALAQIPTGTLSGKATDANGNLPGVTVTVSSPNLQGDRVAVTGANGDYIFTYLPAGEYTVKFELSGYQTVDAVVKMSAAQNSRVDAELQLGLTEEILVTGRLETISTSSSVATTYEAEMIDMLPVGRTILAAAELAPGVAATGPSNRTSISGGQSWENLWLVNGVSVNDNIRNTPTYLFIEDAIQETTISTGAVSAEYGRFAGGVINSLTKSGGNELHGSFRVSVDNDKWRSKTPVSVEPLDKKFYTYEATLGGYVMKDRLWYFLAGRDYSEERENQTPITNLPYNYKLEELRWEAKLTASLTQNHRLIGSYLDRNQDQFNNRFGTILDYASLDTARSLPQSLLAINYNGVMTENFFMEAQYSQKQYSFVGSGGDYTDLIRGTVVRDNTHYWRWNSPTFCGDPCPPEIRDNENYFAKGNLFLTSPSVGSHDISFGYDLFDDQRTTNNYQSASNWVWWPTHFVTDADGDPLLAPDGSPYPIAWGDDYSSDFTWYPIFEESLGTHFKTHGIYLNDRWRLNNNWSFNIGLRFDKNDGVDGGGNKVAKDDHLSPRLAVTFDPFGDGNWIFNASYGHYVQAVANTGNVVDTEGGGNPSVLGYFYLGPNINTDPSQPYLTTHEALQVVFDWLFANGTNEFGGPNQPVGYGYFAGLNNVVADGISSPNAEEITVGMTKRLGTRGLIRGDFIYREYKDLYGKFLNMETGQVEDSIGNVFDLAIVDNMPFFERSYTGFNLQGSYRPSERWNIGGNYTLGHAYGNVDGETSGSGPIASTNNPYYYPEYKDVRWSNPSGDLAIDQRHRARVWAIWEPLRTKHHGLSLSLMQSFSSGTPYSANGTVYTYVYVDNPGYATRPTTSGYYFSKRGEYRTENITRTDLAVNYYFRIPAFGKDLEFFLMPRVTNVFNEKGVVNVNTTVYTRYNTSNLILFNPWETAPTECAQGTALADCKAAGHNWQKGPDFGKPLAEGDYQTPRTYSVSFGIRF